MCRYICVWVPKATRRGHWIPCAGVTGSCGLLDRGAGNWSPICCKNRKWSQPLSLSLSSPGECFKIAMLPRLLLSSSAQMILCPWSPESWDSRHTPSYLANLYLMGTERPSKLWWASVTGLWFCLLVNLLSPGFYCCYWESDCQCNWLPAGNLSFPSGGFCKSLCLWCLVFPLHRN